PEPYFLPRASSVKPWGSMPRKPSFEGARREMWYSIRTWPNENPPTPGSAPAAPSPQAKPSFGKPFPAGRSTAEAAGAAGAAGSEGSRTSSGKAGGAAGEGG